jgi:hypothetical protein
VLVLPGAPCPCWPSFMFGQLCVALGVADAEGVAAVLADPLLADPLLADPLLADPLLADPLLADPLLADPLLAAVVPDADDVDDVVDAGVDE